ncbi:hypothetical protein ACSVC9_02685 [Clostridium sp. LBM24168]|uniref:hypothetical protein n=1 Tax=Clostridium tyrobutyricum TaxID=1519 RepID=UPI0011C8FEE4|nr:hypothetical protein [Clostridium tyrobutyricum]
MNYNLIDIIESGDFSYSMYKELTDDILSKDNRELNYQNRVIIPMLKKIFANDASIKIVDVSTLYKNWDNRTWHDRSKYAGNYTPDVLIAKNWDIHNRDNNKIEYCMLIEVKKPNADDREHAICEVNDYLNHVPNVILTDLVSWEFYTKDGGKIDREYFTLEEEMCCAKVCERDKDNKIVHWKILEAENPEFLVEKLGFPQKREDDPEEWKKILRKLRSVIIS